MKIGILTFQDANNYGAVLQAYALKETIKKINKDVEIIDYKQPYILKSHKIIKINNTNIFSLSKSIMYNLLYFNLRYSKKCKFDKFRKKHLNISEKKFIYPNEITGYDIYIVGSDQVWNFDITNFDETYFLNFCEDKKRISYAASIGKECIDRYEESYYEKYLDNFDSISVREESAKELLRKFTKKTIHTVLDPTLLADNSLWDNIAPYKNIINDKYILVYMISYDVEVFKIAKMVSKMENMKVLYINDSIKKNIYGFNKAKKVGPQEFISLFKNASFVVTNSFHGTSFSIIFNKDFITIPHKTRGTRMVNLLNILNLDHRLIEKNSHIQEDYELGVDYTIPNKLLSLEKEKSLKFLKNSINDSNRCFK